jgi:hypothetical protein
MKSVNINNATAGRNEDFSIFLALLAVQSDRKKIHILNRFKREVMKMAIHSTGAIENRGRDIKSLVVRAANVGIDSADVLLEVFRALNASDGPSTQQLYVQRLVAVPPNQLQTFDNIFADNDAVTVKVTTSNLGQDTISVSVSARDAQQRRIPGIQPTVERIPNFQSQFGGGRPIAQ